MARNRWKRQLGLAVLLLAVCGAAACGRKEDGSDGAAKAETLKSMAQIKKVSFRETFGQYFEVGVIATEEEILYTCSKQDVLGKTEPEVISKSFGCGHDTWWDLVSIYSHNLVFDWKEQEYYVNKCYGQEPGQFEEYPEVEFLEEGDFFNIAGASPDLIQASPPGYYGIDQNEKRFRGDYNGHVEIYINDEDTLYTGRSYGSYGLPDEYGEFRREFWDLIIGHTGLSDWRFELGDWGRENLYAKYPYMLGEGEEREIRYFSLLESYGGKESALAVSLVYDGGEQSIRYRACSPPKTYSVDRSGQPVLYCGEQSLPWEGVEAVKNVSSVPGVLAELIQRYEVGSWENGVGGTEYVRQGGFYNIENAGLVEDTNERAFRSRYDALLHVVYTDGEHVEIQLENGRLPEAYNDFRDELWDAMIPDINEGQEVKVPDWRDSIDRWGKEYMCIKYPYMK
jgi:hypothetical protein